MCYHSTESVFTPSVVNVKFSNKHFTGGYVADARICKIKINNWIDNKTYEQVTGGNFPFFDLPLFDFLLNDYNCRCLTNSELGIFIKLIYVVAKEGTHDGKLEIKESALARRVGLKSAKLPAFLDTFWRAELLEFSDPTPEDLRDIDKSSREVFLESCVGQRVAARQQINATSAYEARYSKDYQDLSSALEDVYGKRILKLVPEIWTNWGSLEKFQAWANDIQVQYGRSKKDISLVGWIEICMKKEMGLIK